MSKVISWVIEFEKRNAVLEVVSGLLAVFGCDLAVAFENAIPKDRELSFGMILGEAISLLPDPVGDVSQQVIVGTVMPRQWKMAVVRHLLPEANGLEECDFFYESHSGNTLFSLWHDTRGTAYVFLETGAGSFNYEPETISRIEGICPQFLKSTRECDANKYTPQWLWSDIGPAWE